MRHCSVVIGTVPGSQLAEHSEKIILISTTIITELESFTSLADLFIGAHDVSRGRGEMETGLDQLCVS